MKFSAFSVLFASMSAVIKGLEISDGQLSLAPHQQASPLDISGLSNMRLVNRDNVTFIVQFLAGNLILDEDIQRLFKFLSAIILVQLPRFQRSVQ